MLKPKRDPWLDFLKTLGCFLMLLAHSHVETRTLLSHYAVFVGTFAPVFFFGVSGVTTLLQLASRPLSYFLIFYPLLFVYGLSFNGAKGVNFWQEPQCEVIQGIALGILVSALLLSRFGEKVSLLFPLPFLLHLGVKKLGLNLPGITGFLFPPGIFPLFPWLSFFLWGILCHRYRTLGLTLTVAAGAAYFAMALAGYGHCEKWEMNSPFFLLGLSLYGFLALMDRFAPLIPDQLNYLGRRSLLFFYAHYLVLQCWRAVGFPLVPALTWTGALAGAVLLCWVTERLNFLLIARFSSHIWFWVFLLTLVLLPPLFLPPAAFTATSYLSGFLFALNYRQLHQLASPKPPQIDAGDRFC
ncbi:acyltransferase family protein [Ammonifex thiophilus]|nr:acyltransferase family protein [Ammonifex thiophilus]